MKECFSTLTLPLPRVPDSQYVESESHDYQESVVSGRIGWQSDEIEPEKDYGHGDVSPAIQRVAQCQGEKDHDDRNRYQYCDFQQQFLGDWKLLLEIGRAHV